MQLEWCPTSVALMGMRALVIRSLGGAGAGAGGATFLKKTDTSAPEEPYCVQHEPCMVITSCINRGEYTVA
jgi:hypothetical protein